jgi:hypothetical protein
VLRFEEDIVQTTVCVLMLLQLMPAFLLGCKRKKVGVLLELVSTEYTAEDYEHTADARRETIESRLRCVDSTMIACRVVSESRRFTGTVRSHITLQ